MIGQSHSRLGRHASIPPAVTTTHMPPPAAHRMSRPVSKICFQTHSTVEVYSSSDVFIPDKWLPLVGDGTAPDI